jgi:N utilization substance protein B
MLSRRHLRIKVLQALYSAEENSTTSVGVKEKNLFKSIDNIYDLFIYNLSVLAELQSVAFKIIEEKKNKKLPTQEDLNPNMKFCNNSILAALLGNVQLQNECKRLKINWLEDYDTLRKIFRGISESNIYQQYMHSDEDDFETQKAFVIKIFKYFIADNEILTHLLEEKNIYWADDHFFVCGYLVKYLKSLKSSFSISTSLPSLYKDEEDDAEFVSKLFKNTIYNDKEFEEIVMTRAKNWESDRIAMVDMILMKMAVCELVYLTSIPIKVTLNEYIDLSKEYSTPKSKLFINGVLDKIIPDLKENGKIVKIGRGLMD